MDKVAYIIKTKQGSFKGFIALLNPDGDDSALYVLHSTDRFTDLEKVQEELKQLPSDIKIFLNPISPNESGISWLSELEAVNPILEKIIT